MQALEIRPAMGPAVAVATFASHVCAENAVKALGKAGFDITQLSVVGRGYHVDEQVTGFYNRGDRLRFWGLRGALWPRHPRKQHPPI